MTPAPKDAKPDTATPVHPFVVAGHFSGDHQILAFNALKRAQILTLNFFLIFTFKFPITGQ